MIGDEVTIIAVHVDDSTIFASSDAAAAQAKEELNNIRRLQTWEQQKK